MALFVMNVDKNIARLSRTEPLTSGSSKVYLVEFIFSPEWKDLSKIAVFRSGETVVDVLLDESGICLIPWEVLVNYGGPIDFGVYGTRNGDVVLPTIWVTTEDILEGVVTGAESSPPSQSLYDQILDRLKKLDDLNPLTLEELEVILT